MPQLDRSGGVALYYQLETILRRRVESGDFAPGDQLPTEDELMEQFGVSRATVRRALADLSDQGLLVRRAGKGTFVIGPKLNQGLNVLVSFSEQIRAIGKTPSSRLLVLDVRSASSEVQTSAKKVTDHVVELIKPQDVRPEQGFCYIARLRLKRPGDRGKTRSTCVLLEDGKPLGPAGAIHAKIRKHGKGHFSHWTPTTLCQA